MGFLVRISLALAAVVASGCACVVLDDSGDEGDGGCFIGEMCPDGSCAVGIPIAAAYPCCGFGGECAPSEDTDVSETTDGASTSEASTSDGATSSSGDPTSTTADTTSDATSGDATSGDATTSDPTTGGATTTDTSSGTS